MIVAGDWPAREQCEQALGEQGLFLGSVDYEQVPAVHAAIDAFVLPSNTEGLPCVLLEAGAASRPPIATTVSGVAELIQDGETGLPLSVSAAVDVGHTYR